MNLKKSSKGKVFSESLVVYYCICACIYMSTRTVVGLFKAVYTLHLHLQISMLRSRKKVSCFECVEKVCSSCLLALHLSVSRGATAPVNTTEIVEREFFGFCLVKSAQESAWRVCKDIFDHAEMTYVMPYCLACCERFCEGRYSYFDDVSAFITLCYASCYVWWVN